MQVPAGKHAPMSEILQGQQWGRDVLCRVVWRLLCLAEVRQFEVCGAGNEETL